MSFGPFIPAFEQLPGSLPVFPLTGVLLLPRGHLPLNIFEPRYIAMIDAALATDRLVGMVQPCDPEGGESPAGQPALYRTACAGRITSFDETEDGRYLITLTGICRFHILGDTLANAGYRRAEADWSAFADDYREQPLRFDRQRLTTALDAFFRQHGISADWDALEETPDERLVTSLSMICPFEPTEKQALLEAPTLAARAEMMVSLVEMAVFSCDDGQKRARH
ncbi:MAG: peptidase S16 [Inquilinus sp.]|nr:peptidase S16 [Inquilinus sp.]